MLPTDRCLHELFADQVRRSPDAPALIDDETQLTYAQLDRRAGQLAARLRALGVGPDQLVGVLMERRAEYVVACLAALQAGGAFLVLELAYPPDLLGDVLADAAPRVVVTLAAHAHRLPADCARIVLDADNGLADDKLVTDGRPAAENVVDARPTPESLAFVSYSSGTTGRPKGIANPHRAAVRSYAWRFGVSDQRPGDRVACNVFFVWEMLRPLLRGASVYVIGDDVISDPPALLRFLRRHRITETLMTPSLLETVLARVGATLDVAAPDLRVLWLNGEIVTRTLAERVLAALPEARVLNVYSASETHEIAAGDLRELIALDTTFCPVGRPLDPSRTYVLDAQARRVAAGVEGELCVGGDCLARGYLNLPDRTAEAFVADPFVDTGGARMYRTGDRARLVGDGVLEITGRVGTMVKIRGYSVEPGAVEAALEQSLAVRASAVVADGEGGDKRLVAYVVREPDVSEAGDRASGWTIDGSGHSADIRRILGTWLPHYMIPTVYVAVDMLPVHSSGKIDRPRLPPPPARVLRRPAAGVGAAVTVQTLAQVWADVLDIDPRTVGPDEDFFDLGGHSLVVAELGARLADIFGVDIALADLVARPTPAAHRDLVTAARGGVDTSAGSGPRPWDDVTLATDIVPAGARSAGSPTGAALADARVILLTGATGFVGSFLLDALLRVTAARVLCLVRPSVGDATGRAEMRRLRAALQGRGVWRTDTAERVAVVTGDLGRPLLGLTRSDFDALADGVDAIVHAGAQVNLVYPYAALRDVNVGGTHEVLRLACHGTPVPVHHVSTTGVLPPTGDRWREDTPIDEVADRLVDGYSASKWSAERLVGQAAERGLPVRIYRLGTISGHSVTGVANPVDLLGAIVTESLRLGCAPDVDGWYAEMTPVDHVSAAIARLAADPRARAGVFHLADPDPQPARLLFDRFARLGYPTERVTWDEWVRRWRSNAGTSGAPGAVLRAGMPDPDALRAITLLADQATRPHLRRNGLRRPPIDTALLATYARHFHAQGWLDAAPVDYAASVA